VADLVSARVFSDPPINLARVEKRGDRIHLDDLSWQASNEVLGLDDGAYTMGVRPHHITPTPPGCPSVEIRDRVEITELSGSESVAHFSLGGRNWVSLAAGTHPYRVGETHVFHLLPERCFYFDGTGTVVAKGGAHG